MKKYKYPTLEAIKSICDKYDLAPPEQFSQDWEHEASDPKKLPAVLRGYEQNDLDNEEKFALGAFILTSFDEAYTQGIEPEDAWEKISNFLKKDRLIHQHSIHYWCSWDHSEDEIDDAFAITPLMRELKMSSPEESEEWFNN